MTMTRMMVLAMMSVMLGGCGPSAEEQAAEAARIEAEARAEAERIAYERSIRDWQAEREARLMRPDGWLSLVGLHWLEYGNSFVGRNPRAGVQLAVGPEELGLVTLETDGTVRFRATDGAGVTYDGAPGDASTRILSTDQDESGPTVVGFNQGDASFIAIRRGERIGLRVRSANAITRMGFTGVDRFPIDPGFRLVARFEPHPAGQTLEIINVLGIAEPMANPGVVVFEKGGRSFRLEAVDEGDGKLFLIFADRTSGHETYPAARFLYADPPGSDGTTIVDFNKAYNPPCAFTEFSTCPLPPASNRLDLRIEAGEQKPRKVGGGAPAA